MGAFFDTIPASLLDWIQKQHIFWVATAPLQADGHVNVSPKGAYDCFHIENQNKVWYEDLTGSGNETISHLRENGRITVMFIAFDGPPRIVRLFGTGKSYEFGTPEYHALIPDHVRKPGSRAVVIVDVHKVSTSCGYTIPYYDFRANRSILLENMSRREKADLEFSLTHPNADPREERTEKGMRAYWVNTNLTSLDGLSGLQVAPYVEKVPQSTWTMEGFKKEEAELKRRLSGNKENGGAIDGANHGATAGAEVKTMTTQFGKTNVNVKLVAAFSLGVLTAAIFMMLGEVKPGGLTIM